MNDGVDDGGRTDQGCSGAGGNPEGHPSDLSRSVVLLYLIGLAIAGALGGVIGWGIVDTVCSDRPTLPRQILSDVDTYRTNAQSCAPYRLGGSLVGAAVAAIGAGVVIVLLLRSMSEWRRYHPGRS